MGPLVVQAASWPYVLVVSAVVVTAGPLLLLALAALDRRTR
ncbi:MAG: hypothetical protein ABWX71_06200 [Aeromicrobium sp.]